jgi:hypothetical protein
MVALKTTIDNQSTR